MARTKQALMRRQQENGHGRQTQLFIRNIAQVPWRQFPDHWRRIVEAAGSQLKVCWLAAAAAQH
jgi:hypothetical protein